jgi:hypothetical protein
VVLCELGLLTSNFSRRRHPLRTVRLAPVLVTSFTVKLTGISDSLHKYTKIRARKGYFTVPEPFPNPV